MVRKRDLVKSSNSPTVKSLKHKWVEATAGAVFILKGISDTTRFELCSPPGLE